ncbi:hypothetical protein V6N13_121922 [Hibiscus sabdariffa]
MQRKSDGKILHVQANEDFVDLVFSFLTIPLESVFEMVLGAKGNLTLGSISNLFRDLNTIYVLSIQSKQLPEREYRVINKPIDPKSPKWITVNSLGYLEKKSFVVTDDLVVEPLSSFSSVSLLMELGISDQSN